MSSHPLQRLLAFGLALGLCLALLLALGAALQMGAQGAAWQAFAADALWPRALLLTLLSGLLATVGAVALSLGVLTAFFPGARWPRLLRPLSNMLAVPHAAFAIGLVFLLSPSGWIARAVSPWLSGWQEPPALATVQDSWGLGLVLALVLKETPFLLWAAASELQRSDSAQRLGLQLAAARTMGYGRSAAWWRVIAPQLLAKLRWPVLAVLAYNLTVVDVALIIGPAAPPTLAVLAWQWLQDADPAVQAQGAVAAWVLALVLATVVLLAGVLRKLPAAQALVRRWRTNGRRGHARAHGGVWRAAFAALALAYGVVMLSLAVGSFAGVWAFPALWPSNWTLGAWASVWDSSGTVLGTAALAAACATVALVWAVAWLECAPRHWDARLRPWIYLPLVLPSVLWVLGVHHWALRVGAADHWVGVAAAHSFVVLPYVLIALSPAYQGFDVRYQHAAASMGKSQLRFLLRIKWPLLKAALCSAWAVGVAVSVAQYLPTVYLGGGRVSTVTTEAVALAAGAQRSLTAAYAWLQWLIPVLAFSLAAVWSRPRKFAA